MDRHRLQLPPTMPAPGSLRIETGMYDHAGGERLPTAQGDSLVLGEVDTAAEQPKRHSQSDAPEFGDKIALTGYSVDRRSLQPGEYAVEPMVGRPGAWSRTTWSLCT